MPGKRKYLKNEEGLYMCPECDYTTAKSSTLCMHLNKHDDTRQNKCKFCDKVFLQKQTLEKHLENFSGKGAHPSIKDKDDFECPHETCEFSSSNRGNCRTHFMRIHVSKETNALLDRTGEEISCKTCSNTFVSLGAFYYHSIGCVSLPVTDTRHVLMEQFS
jgi:uncharacterized C2H2 Zn-finger protein